MNLLKQGDIIELEEGHTVYAKVPEHFLYSNRKGCWDLTTGAVQIKDTFEYLAGKYVVTKTSYSGGGTAHGYDVIEDGYLVECKKLDGEDTVHFYQTGSFSALIPNIIPVGQAVVKYVLEEASK